MNIKEVTKKIWILSIAVFIIAISGSDAKSQLFQQDFSSSAVVSDYVSTTPNNGQFNAISVSAGGGTTVSINNGTLQYVRNGANAGSFSRTTDFSPIPSAIIYKIDIAVSGNTTATTSAAVFQVGSGFGTANTAESNANTYARFAINLTATNGTFQVRDITNGTDSANFSGTQTITWVLNNSGTALNYLAPDNTVSTVANDRADLYIGNTLAFNDVTVQTATQTITDLKFTFTGGTATINLDNIQISQFAPTAAAVDVRGRVIQSNGRGIFGAKVTMTDSEGNLRTALTNMFGTYRFANVMPGQNYFISVTHRRYQFEQPSQIQFIGEETNNINFIGTSGNVLLAPGFNR